MTPEKRATKVCRDSGWTIEPWKYDLIVDAIRAAVEAERWECIEAVNLAANDIQTDNEDEYRGYKAGIVAGIAAIRARSAT